MGSIIFQNARCIQISDGNSILLSMKGCSSQSFHESVIICDAVDSTEYLIPLTKKPKVLADLAVDTNFNFELSYVEHGLYRIDKICATEASDDDDDVEPDIDDTQEIVKEMYTDIDRKLLESKNRTKRLNLLHNRLDKCNHSVKRINDVYEELNEYI